MSHFRLLQLNLHPAGAAAGSAPLQIIVFTPFSALLTQRRLRNARPLWLWRLGGPFIWRLSVAWRLSGTSQWLKFKQTVILLFSWQTAFQTSKLKIGLKIGLEGILHMAPVSILRNSILMWCQGRKMMWRGEERSEGQSRLIGFSHGKSDLEIDGRRGRRS